PERRPRTAKWVTRPEALDPASLRQRSPSGPPAGPLTMGLFDALRAGVIELFAHKMRSFLTMLGIIFGVAAVIAMVSISEGARYEALQQIRLMGVNVIHIRRRALNGDALILARKKSPQGLSYSDAEAIQEVCSFAKRVVPVCRVFGDVEVPGEPIHSSVYGVVPGFQEVNR